MQVLVHISMYVCIYYSIKKYYSLLYYILCPRVHPSPPLSPSHSHVRGLVEEDDAWAVQQLSSDSNTLPLAAGDAAVHEDQVRAPDQTVRTLLQPALADHLPRRGHMAWQRGGVQGETASVFLIACSRRMESLRIVYKRGGQRLYKFLVQSVCASLFFYSN